jgi:hypothetical protein
VLGENGHWREFMTAHYQRKEGTPRATAAGSVAG